VIPRSEPLTGCQRAGGVMTSHPGAGTCRRVKF
jgi:hypothetical protein